MSNTVVNLWISSGLAVQKQPLTHLGIFRARVYTNILTSKSPSQTTASFRFFKELSSRFYTLSTQLTKITN